MASVTHNHEVAVVNTETLAVVKRIPDGKFPDGTRVFTGNARVFVSDEIGWCGTVIDAYER